MNELWETYYSELDPYGRAAIYAQNIGVTLPEVKRSAVYNMRLLEPTNAEDVLRKDLFLWRYVGPKGQDMDRVMAAMMELMHFGRNQNAMDLPTIRRLIQGLGWDVVKDAGEAGQELLLAEIRNGADRYLSCCRGMDYGRTFFGLIAPTVQRQNDKTTEDIWMATRGIERIGTRGFTEEDIAHLHIYEEVVLDAFYGFDVDARDWFENYERMH